jgi:hypothetical protein
MDLANVCRLFTASYDLLWSLLVPPLISGDGPALNQAHEYSDHREHEEDMNEPAQSVRADHSQQPKNQEQGDDSPKHGVVLSDKGAARGFTAIRLRRAMWWENPLKY